MLYQELKKNKLPRLPTLLHICERLDTTLREFFDDPIFDEIEDFSENKQDTK